jgi:hypothetical protein
MKKIQTLKLIDGTYNPNEAKEIIMSVFSSKIQFHQMKNFSRQERFGKEDKASIKRITELTKSMEAFLKIVKKAEKENKNIVLKSSVETQIE